METVAGERWKRWLKSKGVVMTACGLLACILSIRRNYLWYQFAALQSSSPPSSEAWFNLFESTAIYHTPWARMLLPLLINAAFVWAPWLGTRFISLLSLFWVSYIYVIWSVRRVAMARQMTSQL